MSSSKSSSVPSEYLVSDALSRGIEASLINVSVGFVVGGLSAVVLRGRGGTFRKAVAGLGAGIGLGSGWAKTSKEVRRVGGVEQESGEGREARSGEGREARSGKGVAWTALLLISSLASPPPTLPLLMQIEGLWK
jgi:hypothetical protein